MTVARKKKRFLPGIALFLMGLGAVAQLGLWVLSDSDEAETQTGSGIESAVSGIKDPRKRLHRRVVLSVDQFRLKRGRLPQRLEELVPEWFAQVPLDPRTGKPFSFTVSGDRFFVGDGASKGAQSAINGDEELSEAEREELLTSFDAFEPDDGYRYDPTGRRDPFTPVDFSIKVSVDTTVPPLQRFSLGQLKLSAILRGGDEPSAMVETQEGMGYPVKQGSKIGNNQGEVVEILNDKIVIRETHSDFSGAVKERFVEMNLRADSESGAFSRPSVNSKKGVE